MHFNDLSSFFAMGGYALYVWLSFAAAALSLAAVWLDACFSKRSLLTQVLAEQARQARIKAAAEQNKSNGEAE